MPEEKGGGAHLQIGNLAAADAAFHHVESLAAATKDPARLANLLARNRALQCIVDKDYAAAAWEYESCIEVDPTDAVALKNKAAAPSHPPITASAPLPSLPSSRARRQPPRPSSPLQPVPNTPPVATSRSRLCVWISSNFAYAVKSGYKGIL